MARGDDSVLGELATNLDGLSVRGKGAAEGGGTGVGKERATGSAGPAKNSSASAAFDNDVLPPSGRFGRIDVTADCHEPAGERKLPSMRRLASSSSASSGVSMLFAVGRPFVPCFQAS